MWCEAVLRNAAGEAWGDRSVDYVDIAWHECGRILKKQTRGGQPVRLLLPPGQQIRHGDVLAETADHAVVVNVLPTELIVARPGSIGLAAQLALELGNLHHPTQILIDQIRFERDEKVMEILTSLQIPWSSESGVFQPTPVAAAVQIQPAADYRVLRAGSPS